jgi:hypothetical protein
MKEIRLFNKLRFRFHLSKSYGSYGSGSGSTTLLGSAGNQVENFSAPPLPILQEKSKNTFALNL